ncbi:MAG: choline/ethanolamine kinase family protein [Devosia sp.]
MSDYRRAMQAIEQRILALPIWRGSPELKPLVGGLSNVSYTATDATGTYVVRITREFPFHHVAREREVMSARAAHAAGFAPEVVHAEPGMMVSRFIEGRVFTAEDVRTQMPRIVALLKRFHHEMPARIEGAGFIFWPAHVNRDYLRMLDGHLPPRSRDHWQRVNTELETVQAPLPIVVGHHDLLPGNFIDDGRRLWLIDFEYAGFGTAMFDLANLSSNSSYTAAETDALLAGYFGAPVPEEIARSHAAMACASLLREMLWSHVSGIHLDAPGANYVAYAFENEQRLEVALERYHKDFV